MGKGLCGRTSASDHWRQSSEDGAVIDELVGTFKRVSGETTRCVSSLCVCFVRPHSLSSDTSCENALLRSISICL